MNRVCQMLGFLFLVLIFGKAVPLGGKTWKIIKSHNWKKGFGKKVLRLIIEYPE